MGRHAKSLEKKKSSSDRISDQVKSVGERYHCWSCVRSKEFQRVIGANHGGDDFCFRCMRTTQHFHRYYGARWLGQIVKGTFRSSAQGKERNEERNERFGIRALVPRVRGLYTESQGLFIERVFILLRGGCETLIPSFFFGRETQEGDLE